jgi:hypothetical protein
LIDFTATVGYHDFTHLTCAYLTLGEPLCGEAAVAAAVAAPVPPDAGRRAILCVPLPLGVLTVAAAVAVVREAASEDESGGGGGSVNPADEFESVVAA